MFVRYSNHSHFQYRQPIADTFSKPSPFPRQAFRTLPASLLSSQDLNALYLKPPIRSIVRLFPDPE